MFGTAKVAQSKLGMPESWVADSRYRFFLVEDVKAFNALDGEDGQEKPWWGQIPPDSSDLTRGVEFKVFVGRSGFHFS
jgi:hypothetical protein